MARASSSLLPLWKSGLENVQPIENLSALPHYGFLFFFKNMGEFRACFWLLTAGSVVSAMLRFFSVYLLGEIITRVASLSTADIFGFYLPLLLCSTVGKEVLDFYTRRYGEAFPTVYVDSLSLRFYLTILELNFQRLFNLSKERLNALIGRYVGNVHSFIADWFWGTSRRITSFMIVLVILYSQSPYVLAANLVYMALFLTLSLKISRRFSPIAAAYSQQTLETQSVLGRFQLNLNTVKRLGLREFFAQNHRHFLSCNWARFKEVRLFHAQRWLLQLNLFNVVYISTLTYGVFQVKEGAIPLGFLVLIKYSFDQLWEILVYVIEYYVALIQQREDSEIFRREISEILLADRHTRILKPRPWRSVALQNATVEFEAKSDREPAITISVPQFRITPKSKVGIIGPSGSGKTVILHILLNLLPYRGEYRLDAEDLRDTELPTSFMTIINNSDPLFNISLRDNILLGRKLPQAQVDQVLQGTRVDAFASNLEVKVGHPAFNLSTGQEQRIRLARGLMSESEILLLDEPFNGIDDHNKRAIMEFLGEYLKDRSVVLVTHDASELALADEVYELRGGVLSPTRPVQH